MYNWLKPVLNFLHTIATSSRVQPILHPLVWLYMRIAEPRIIRLMQFGIYICMIIAGSSVLYHPPEKFEGAIGVTMVYIFGGFMTIGALLGAIAVLPGFWWLERVGILSLITGLAIYVVIIMALNSSGMGLIISAAFALTFAQRWQEIKRFQLAPRRE